MLHGYSNKAKPSIQNKKVAFTNRVKLFIKNYIPVNLHTRLYVDNELGKQPRHLDNLFNPEMNNIDGIDFYQTTRESIDGVLSRYT